MNKIQLVGRLTKDPELTFAAGTGTAITKFVLAVNRPQFDKSKPQEADFIPCVCFGKRAEAIANYVQKGHRFGLSGRLQINKYTDKEGNNRWSTDVVVEDFEFMQDKGGVNITSASNKPDNSSTDEGMTLIDDDSDIPF